MKRSLSDISLHAIEHMRLGTTDHGERVVTNPVESYQDQALFELEMSKVVRQRPVPILASAKIRNRGDYFAKEICGIPLVIMRDEEGMVRTFLNVCRHRGAQLIANGEGRDLKNFTCPFHGWSYRSNGRLAHIPQVKKYFSSEKVNGHGLVELKTTESVGMIWAVLDGSSNFPLDNVFSNFADDFSQLSVAPRFPMKEFVQVGNFNWKIGVEAFLEVDHFPFAHAPYLSNLEFPNLSLVDSVEENYRIVVPLKKPKENQFVLEWAQVMYFIFPSTFLLIYSDHVALLNMTPISVDKTEFRYIPLVPFEEDLVRQKIQEKADFLKIIIQQDLDILEGIQKGLKSGANSHFTFTRTEHVLGAFHKRLAELLI